jgi:aminopeptidase-like protein
MHAARRDSISSDMHALITRLYPICRSITGNGLRETLRILQREVPLIIHEVPTGTQVFDWTVPKEWNIRDAYIKNEKGIRLVDFQQCSLHVLNYSVPVRATMRRAELEPHLHSLPEQPSVIPYKTSYYCETWGFCLSQEQRDNLGEGPFEVCIDSTLEPGSLSYGELFIAGETTDEVLISTHCCHPYMANDNLSGIGVSLQLAKHILNAAPRLSYRFLFIPGTIGSITWLALNEPHSRRIKHGLVLTALGDPSAITYKKSRRGDAEIDRIVQHVLRNSCQAYKVIEFSPYGYDERQYCSPGFDLAVGCLMRSQYGTYSEYHTSADNLEFVRPECLANSLQWLLLIVFVLENNRTYINQNPKCEPQLGKRGLYSTLGGQTERKAFEMAMLWVLNLSDGNASLLEIAERSGIEFKMIKSVADLLEQHSLLQRIDRAVGSSSSAELDL